MDGRSDIWSLGAVLYEMTTGERAFRGENIFVAAYEIANDDPIAVDALRPDVPAELQRIIERALKKNPDDRYQSMREMEAALGSMQPLRPESSIPTEPVITSLPDDSASARRRRISRYSLAGAALTVGAAAVLAFAGEAVFCGLMPASTWCATEVVTSIGAETKPALDYWITVQRYRDGAPYREPFRLDREMVFESDYRVFLHFQTAQDGNLYILNEGPAENSTASGYNLLFPKVTINSGEAFLPAGHQIQIPESGGFVFDEEVGVETVWLVWSKDPIGALEAVRGRANAQDLGVIEDPAETAAIAGVLSAGQASEAAVERLRDEQKTRLRTAGDVLIHRVLLEHR